jgi:zinc transport system substrate-binding protein
MRTVLAILVIGLLVAGCGGGDGDAGRTTVVTAFYPLAFAAQEIGGAGVAVRNLTPPGAEPHDVELTPRAVAELQRADVVLYLSHGFQPAVEQAVRGAAGKRVDVLEELRLRRTDPHVWLDPILYAQVAQRMGKVLGRPAHADAFAARLRRLDADFRQGLERCSRRDFVTSHAAFGYLASRYRLHQIPITGIDPESEPSARRLAALARLVKRERIHTVFFERLVSPVLAETVAREAAATTAVLDPIEGLTPAEASRGDTYFTLMRRNLHALRTALGCR